jgi:anti-sigma-K factor RskA
MSPEKKEELASLYALDLLEGDELRAFESTLAADPALVALVGELRGASTLLARSLPHQPAPADMRDTVLQKIENKQLASEPSRETRASFAWMPWAVAAGIAVFCGLTLLKTAELSAAKDRLENDNKSLLTRITELNAERDRLQIQVSNLQEEKTSLEVKVASFETREPLQEIRSTDLVPQAGAPAKDALAVLWDQKRQTGVVDLARLPPPPVGKDYQLWIISPEAPNPLSAGLVTAAVGLRSMFQSPQEVGQVAAIAISLEPKGGSLTPQGPVIYVGKM